jgi:ketosteroid isomerase-like protein
LIVSTGMRSETSGSITAARVFEHTDDGLIERFMPKGKLNVVDVMSLPTLFMEEVEWRQARSEEPARRIPRLGEALRADAAAESPNRSSDCPGTVAPELIGHITLCQALGNSMGRRFAVRVKCT